MDLGGGALKPRNALRILMQDRRFRALIAGCTSGTDAQDQLLTLFQHLWEDEVCRLHIAEWVFQKPDISVALGEAIFTLIGDYWIHEVMCSRADLPRTLAALCRKSPYYSVRRVVDDDRAARRVRAALSTRKNYILNDNNDVARDESRGYLQRKQRPRLHPRNYRVSSQQGSLSARRDRARLVGTNRIIDFSIKELRKAAKDPMTPKHILLWMADQEFQPYLGLELSTNPSSDRDVFLKLLRHGTADKRIWRRLLVNIAKHPRADREVLRAILELNPPGSVLSEIARRSDLDKQIAKEVLSRSNSLKVLQLIQTRFPNLV